ncbi:MAG: hypothetical protein J5I93_02715 [Pirellulaceae bacterium]|nr:hypothetical protein [Pirellulaceae bacterium]
MPLIARVHAKVLRSFRDPARLKGLFDDDDAISLMAEKTLLYIPRRPFRAFCQVVIANRAIDILRRLRREPLASLEVNSLPADDEEHAEPECPQHRLGPWIAERRELLDSIDWRRPAYQAVFLVDQRLRRAIQLADVAAEDNALWFPEVCQRRSDLLAWLEPWHMHEGGLRFHPAVPPILDVWSLAQPRIDRVPHRLSGKDLVELLKASGDSTASFSHDQWRALTSRATRRARESIQDDVLWSCYFR